LTEIGQIERGTAAKYGLENSGDNLSFACLHSALMDFVKSPPQTASNCSKLRDNGEKDGKFRWLSEQTRHP